MTTETELIERLAAELRRANIPFLREVAIGGAVADLFVPAPDGRKFVIEVKAWDKSPGFRNRAAHQADLIKQALDADHAFVVIRSLERSSVQQGVITPSRLVPVLREQLSRDAPTRSRRGVEPQAAARHVFAGMPFDGRYDDTFWVAMVPAARSVGAVCKRVDQEEYSGDIVAKIQELIRESVAVIVDLSEANANVLYEAGFAHALNKPTVHVCSTPLGELPFNVARWNTIAYKRGRTHLLTEPLARRLRAALE
jgi:hypothetical protein